MRRFFFIAAAGVLLVALSPASALARGHHHRSHHKARTHVHRTRVRRFGDVTGAPTTSTSPDNAGTVSSFDGTTLIIQTSSGPVSGVVTANTEFECQAAGSTSTMHGDGDRGNGGGDSGTGGDDNNANGGDNAPGGDNTAAGNDDNTASGSDDNNTTGGDENNGASCSSANLTPGTVVREAELRISSSGQEWKKLELIS